MYISVCTGSDAGTGTGTGTGALDPVTCTTSTTATYSRVAEGEGQGEGDGDSGVAGSPSSLYGTSASSNRCEDEKIEDMDATAEFADMYCGLSKDEVSNEDV